MAALAFLGAVLASGNEIGSLPGRWISWLAPTGLAALFGLIMFRFPRALGLPVLVLVGTAAWFGAGAIKDFAVLDPVMPPANQAQPLMDRELVTAFNWRADYLSPPRNWPFPPFELYRLRPGNAPPAEWWWSGAVAAGWAKSAGAIPPANPQKFAVYHLSLKDEKPAWVLFKPELQPPP